MWYRRRSFKSQWRLVPVASDRLTIFSIVGSRDGQRFKNTGWKSLKLNPIETRVSLKMCKN